MEQLQPFQCSSGVQPSTDKTAASTVHWVMSDKVRFRNGVPQKIKGWMKINYENGLIVEGKCRSITSNLINGATYLFLGTNKFLYMLSGNSLVNITPLKTTYETKNCPFQLDYRNLGTNPITTINGSSTLTIYDTSAQNYRAGDTIELSGATSVGGISSSYINAQNTIRSLGTNSYTITVNATATSNATGGGSSVYIGSGLVTVSYVANGLSDGNRIKISNSDSLCYPDTSSHGIDSSTINAEFVIRDALTDSFTFMTSGIAQTISNIYWKNNSLQDAQFVNNLSALVQFCTFSGGDSVNFYRQIDAGVQDESYGQGYGMGLYGAGLYGVSKISSNLRQYPRIWFFDRYGQSEIMTAGNQTGIYRWSGSAGTAPVIVANAPTEVNYAFVSNNILVTFGAGGTGNHIFASDYGDIEEWTASSTNQVYETYLQGAGRLWSNIPVNGQNLIFTPTQTYLFNYVGLPSVWDVQLLEASVGIISPQAGCSVNGVAYWMGQNNFYRWAGGNIEIIPANSQITSTIFRYVFENMTTSQQSKIYCWYNRQFDEIWWHFPSLESSDPDRIARLNRSELSWCPDTMDRTAAERPDNMLVEPRLIDSEGVLYAHEHGNDANGTPLKWSLKSRLISGGKNNLMIKKVYPDSEQYGDITMKISSYRFPQSDTPMFEKSYTIAPNTEWVETQVGGRFWQYELSGESLGQNWLMGNWQELVQDGASW